MSKPNAVELIDLYKNRKPEHHDLEKFADYALDKLKQKSIQYIIFPSNCFLDTKPDKNGDIRFMYNNTHVREIDMHKHIIHTVQTTKELDGHRP